MIIARIYRNLNRCAVILGNAATELERGAMSAEDAQHLGGVLREVAICLTRIGGVSKKSGFAYVVPEGKVRIEKVIG